jgi:DNA-binding CsgD family transcriptional regulator
MLGVPAATLEELDAVIRLAREAATRHERWHDVLAHLQRIFGAHGSSFFIPAIEAHEPQYLATGGFGLFGFAEYLQDWASQDAWWQQAVKTSFVFSPGTVAFGHDLLSLTELQKTAFYADFTRRYDYDDVAALFVAGGCGEVPPIQLSLHRPIGAPPFDEEVRRCLHYIAKPLEDAALAFWHLRKLQGTKAAMDDALNAIPTPTLVISRELTLEFVNNAAETELKRKIWLQATHRNLIRVGHLDLAALQALLRSKALGEVATSVIVDNRRQTAVVRLAWVAPDSRVLLLWPKAHLILTIERPGALDHEQALLQNSVKRFRLTRTEQRVLALLLKANSPQEVAETLQVGITTVRTHIRSIYEKAGVHRQAELLRVVFSDGDATGRSAKER